MISAMQQIQESPRFQGSPVLQSLLSQFSFHVQQEFLTIFSAPKDLFWEQRLLFIEMLTRAQSGTVIMSVLRYGVPPSFFEHPLFFALIEGMLERSWDYRFELALLFTQIPVMHLPYHLQTQSKGTCHAMTTWMMIVPTYCSWWLCAAAEDCLEEAIADTAVLLVNHCILLKFNGRISGVALHTMLLPDGTLFQRGCWYAPIDRDDRQALRAAFYQGRSTVTMDGEWTLIRAFRPYTSLSMEALQDCADTLPQRFPSLIRGMTRCDYRNATYESF